jgi:hypothetical protein
MTEKKRQSDPDRAHTDADRRHDDAGGMRADSSVQHDDAVQALQQCAKLTEALAVTNTCLAVYGEKNEELGRRVSQLDGLMRADSGSGYDTKFGQQKAALMDLDSRVKIIEGEVKGFKSFLVKIAVVVVSSGLIGVVAFIGALWVHLKT